MYPKNFPHHPPNFWGSFEFLPKFDPNLGLLFPSLLGSRSHAIRIQSIQNFFAEGLKKNFVRFFRDNFPSLANRRVQDPGSRKLSSACGLTPNRCRMSPENLLGSKIFRSKVATSSLSLCKGDPIPKNFTLLDPSGTGQKSLRTA